MFVPPLEPRRIALRSRPQGKSNTSHSLPERSRDRFQLLRDKVVRRGKASIYGEAADAGHHLLQCRNGRTCQRLILVKYLSLKAFNL